MDSKIDVAEQNGISSLNLVKPKPTQPLPQTGLKFSNVVLTIILILSILAVVLSSIALYEACKEDNDDNKQHTSTYSKKAAKKEVGLLQRSEPISKIAFGSCTTYYRHPQHIWTQGVIPSDPDMWIWLGDFAYFDSYLDYCTGAEDENIPECKCEMTVLTYPPHHCMNGNLSYARERARTQLMDRDYYQFLDFMCPSLNDSSVFPPIGDKCKKPIIGTYDDHDFVANNGNRLLQHKYEYKNLFLDSIGVEQSSSRRSAVGGLETKYTINPDGPKNQRIDVFLLDERYERDSVPCSSRRDWCEEILASDEVDHDYLWCDDFLNTGGPGADGSCCRADDVWANGWCKENPGSAEDDELWDIACDPSSERFSSIALEVDEDTNKLRPKDTYEVSDRTYTSQFCDVLGIQQRAWFQEQLKESTAPLKLIGSGSVLFGNPIAGSEGPGSGDDIQTYPVAQSNLIHILSKVDNGCVIVVTGDFHFSDIKMAEGGSDTPYSPYFPTTNLTQPIYQIMSSGLTESTAKDYDSDEPCRTFREDKVGLRPFGPCGHVVKPSFGMLEIDWEKRIVHMQLRAKETGEVTDAVNGHREELSINIDTCQVVSS